MILVVFLVLLKTLHLSLLYFETMPQFWDYISKQLSKASKMMEDDKHIKSLEEQNQKLLIENVELKMEKQKKDLNKFQNLMIEQKDQLNEVYNSLNADLSKIITNYEKQSEKSDNHINSLISECSVLTAAVKELQDEIRELKLDGAGQKKQIAELANKNKLKDVRIKMLKKQINTFAKHCIVCWENPADHVLVPCGHICLCTECVKNKAHGSKCPHCRAAYTSVYKCYPAGVEC